jgi:hypothetical protein
MGIALARALPQKRRSARARELRLLTDLNPRVIQQGYLSVRALEEFRAAGFEVHHLAGLHAKIIVTDRAAYVGSANLTVAGLAGGNVELGLRLTGPARSQVADEVERFFAAATLISEERLIELARLESQPVDREKQIGQPAQYVPAAFRDDSSWNIRHSTSLLLYVPSSGVAPQRDARKWTAVETRNARVPKLLSRSAHGIVEVHLVTWHANRLWLRGHMAVRPASVRGAGDGTATVRAVRGQSSSKLAKPLTMREWRRILAQPDASWSHQAVHGVRALERRSAARLMACARTG